MAVVTIPMQSSSRDLRTGDLSVFPGGEVTVTVDGMLPVELAEWTWMFETFNPGLPADLTRLTVRGWTVRHAAAGEVGVLLQNLAGRIHVEWYDAQLRDHCYVGQAAQWRHGVGYMVQARQRSAQPLPLDPVPEAVPAPAPAVPLSPLRAGSLVRYHGSKTDLHGGLALAFWCDCDEDCDGYRLEPSTLGGPLSMCLVHVRRSSLSPVAADS